LKRVLRRAAGKRIDDLENIPSAYSTAHPQMDLITKKKPDIIGLSKSMAGLTSQ
jgi:hypothetical protein